jgi:glycosyltransferase involved in cell wall biosynthesis
MGRNAAGESFLRGYLSYSTSNEFWVQVQQQSQASSFVALAERYSSGKAIKAITRETLGALREPGTMFLPSPTIGNEAWKRAAFSNNAWSICGITHTTSSAGAMDALTDLLVAPVQPWDALICTSNAVQENVRRVIEAQFQYLKERLGITQLVLPQLPIIPLGIHTSDFDFTEEQRSNARERINADADTLVVTYMGRLSFHAKAHPLAMYQAIERAALQSGKRVILIECGWHSNEYIGKAFSTAAREACPSIDVIHLDGRESSARETAWAAADVFCSFSDNIQETFGIVPIEAMAAGLPVVVTDWDGYKDSVRHEVDGFRIPTSVLPAGYGGDLALRHALGIDTYDMYCGHTCMTVAVDIEFASEAFRKLFESAELRQEMGEKGKQRAKSVFDWRVIIPQYEALWQKLAEIRRDYKPHEKNVSFPWPARMDPFYAFGHYASTTIKSETVVSLCSDESNKLDSRLKSFRNLAMVNFALYVLPDDAEVEGIISALSSGPKSAEELVSAYPSEKQEFGMRHIMVLAKLGIVSLSK